MPRTRLPLIWQIAASETLTAAPLKWIPANVPGAVQLDWARAHGLPDYTVHNHVHQWEYLSDHAWTYRAIISEVPENETIYLILEGIDYAADISIAGFLLAHHEGSQTPLALDVTDYAREGAEIRIVIQPAPKSRPFPNDRSQANASCKPAVSYGWDFHPRLIPLGLWKEAYLEIRPRTHFAQPPEVSYRLPDLSRATGHLEVSLNQTAAHSLTVRWQLTNAVGQTVLSIETPLAAGEKELRIPFALDEVSLWWPHDQGTPYLYRSEVELIAEDGRVLDTATRRVGFRQVRLIMAEGQWGEPSTFPKSRSHPPITLEINSRAIFVKGANWVCPDIFPGVLTRERYAEQLYLARDSNLAMLRLWGGAGAPHDCFYELCDELGLMVWQEFPLACNLYPDDESYLRILDQESRSLILRLRGHASLTFWCGGNELFNVWSGMTDQSLPIRLLNRNCYDLDPGVPFLPTSPVDGMGHGHYVFRDPNNGEECWSVFQRARCTAYTEFGCPSPASVATLERIIPATELWPPRAGTAWESHHAFGAWLTESHLYLKEIEHYFGPIDNLADLVKNGQLLQSAGYRGLFEEARRQKPTASMALNWCLNEPWPTAANNSLISWPCEPKPALAAVAQACRPTLASARISRFSWEAGDNFDPEIWLLHDGPSAQDSVLIAISLVQNGARRHLLDWQTGPILPNRNTRGPRIQHILSEFTQPDFWLLLDVRERPEWSSAYELRQARPAENRPFNPDHVRVMNL